MTIKFAHVRFKDKDGHVLSNGGTTYAYELDENNHVIGFAFSRCHEKDTFNKFIGRVKAEGRMKSKLYFNICNMTEEDFFELIYA